MREEIYALVQNIKPLDQQEQDDIDFASKWIKSGAELFRTQSPATPPVHLVSYFVVIDDAAEKVLLVDHIKAQLWLPSGGHVDPNEHPKQAAAREAMEELFIEADFIQDNPVLMNVAVTQNTNTPHTDVSFWYAIKADSTQNLKYDEREFNGIKWFPIDNIPTQRIGSDIGRFIEKYKSLKA